MKIEDFIVEIEEYEFIAGLFPKGQISLVHGTYGSGKSYSCIKALNNAGIKPIYVNLDYSAGLDCFDVYQVDYKFLLNIEQIEGISEDSVIVIDTYTVLTQLIEEDGIAKKEADVWKYIKGIRDVTGATVIVVGHTADFVGKDGIFRDGPTLARNSAETLWLEKAEYKATKTKKASIEYILHINKGRGNGGPRLIENWMR